MIKALVPAALFWTVFYLQLASAQSPPSLPPTPTTPSGGSASTLPAPVSPPSTSPTPAGTSETSGPSTTPGGQGSAPSPGPSSTSPGSPASAGAPVQPAAQTGAGNVAVDRFNAQLNADLLDRGIGVFDPSDTTGPDLGQLPLYHPAHFHLGAPYGNFYGLVELYLGLDTLGRPHLPPNSLNPDLPDYPNLELVTTLNYGDHIRGHFQGNLLRLPFRSTEQRTLGFREGFVEVYQQGAGISALPIKETSYYLAARLGRFGQVQDPYPDPLTLFERRPQHYNNYQGALILGSLDHSSGLGLHASAFARLGGSGPSHFIRDAYVQYHHYASRQKIFFEGRAGWMPQDQQAVPANAVAGAQAYLGYQDRNYGVGVFGGETYRKGGAIGLSITLGRNRATELLGLAPSHVLVDPGGLALELPLAQLHLFAVERPRPDETIVGQKDMLRLWNAGSGVGVGSTSDISLGQWGMQKGKNIRRVVTTSPWWLYQVEGVRQPGPLSGNRSTEAYEHFRQDVQYTYYQVSPTASYRVSISAVDADTQKPIDGARIVISGAGGQPVQTVVTNRAGTGSARVSQMPTAAPTIHIEGTANGYQPVTQDASLSPGILNRIVVLFHALAVNITGLVTDSRTGEGVPDVEVILVPASGAPVVHTTGPGGSYQFTTIPPGAYTYQVHKPGYTDQKGNITVIGGQPVTLNFKVVAERGGVLLHLVDIANNPVAGAAVTILDAAGNTVVTRDSGPDGSVAERLDPGAYTIHVTAPGYKPSVTPATVAPGDLKNVTITLEKQ